MCEHFNSLHLIHTILSENRACRGVGWADQGRWLVWAAGHTRWENLTTGTESKRLLRSGGQRCPSVSRLVFSRLNDVVFTSERSLATLTTPFYLKIVTPTDRAEIQKKPLKWRNTKNILHLVLSDVASLNRSSYFSSRILVSIYRTKVANTLKYSQYWRSFYILKDWTD